MDGKEDKDKIVTPEQIKAYCAQVMTARGSWRSSWNDFEAGGLYDMLHGVIGDPHRKAVGRALLYHGFAERGWMLRETIRLLYTDEYTQVTTHALNNSKDENLRRHLTQFTEHFLHLSKDEPELVAYTPDNNYGKADRRVKTTIGRYLKKFFPGLGDSEIRSLTETFKYHYGLEDVLFASTGEDIEMVYVSGPHSCMAYQHPENKTIKTARSDVNYNFGSQMHPVAAYESPGVRVAYMKRNGIINARCMVYDNPNDPKDKRYIRNYGDEVLIRKLGAFGYKSGTMQDVKLKRIPAIASDGRELLGTFVVPYIDDTHSGDRQYQYVLDAGDHLLVTNSKGKGAFGASNTSGLAGTNSTYCRPKNDDYGITDPKTGERGMTPREERSAKQCSCCGTRFKDEHSEFVTEEGAAICPKCIDSLKYKRATGINGRVVYAPEDKTLMAGGTCYMNVPEVHELYSLVELSTKYYPTPEYQTAANCVLLGDEIIARADLVATTGGGREHINAVLRTVRKLVLQTSSIPTKKELAPVFVDTENGILRTNVKYAETTLESWIIDMAAGAEPRDRAAVVKAMLKGETDPKVAETITTWIEPILKRNKRGDLITKAAQASLLAVEEQ